VGFLSCFTAARSIHSRPLDSVYIVYCATLPLRREKSLLRYDDINTKSVPLLNPSVVGRCDMTMVSMTVCVDETALDDNWLFLVSQFESST